MIGRRKFLERLGLGCLTAPLLKEFGDSAVEQVPDPGLSQQEPVTTASVWKWKQQDVPPIVTYTATERTMPGQMMWIDADANFSFTAELKNVNMDLFDELMKP